MEEMLDRFGVVERTRKADSNDGDTGSSVAQHVARIERDTSTFLSAHNSTNSTAGMSSRHYLIIMHMLCNFPIATRAPL